MPATKRTKRARTTNTAKKSEVATQIKRLLAIHGVSVAELAKRVGVDRQTVYKWLNGGHITEPKLAAAAKCFGVHPGVIRYGEKIIDVNLLSECIGEIACLGKELSVVLPPKKVARAAAFVYRDSLLLGSGPDREQARELVYLIAA